MSIGISPNQPFQSSPALDFSSLNGNGAQPSKLAEHNTQQAIDPSALLFNSGKQQDVNFGPPNSTAASPTNSSKTGDSQSNVIQLLTALLTSLIQMLMKLTNGQDQKPNAEQTQNQGQQQNNNGLGTPSADSGASAQATGGGDAGSPAANGGDSGGAPTTTGGNSEDGSGGVPPPITAQLANPNSEKAGTGTGASTVDFPKTSGAENVVNETIKVGPGQTFDGHNQVYTASSKLGNGDQSEDQKPLFELAEGATLKNVILGDNEADGIHVVAANEKPVNVDNVHWKNVGEDALTVKPEGGADVTNLNITNSSAQGANDKIFQLNANANVKVDNFKASDFGTFMRTNGGKQFDKMNLELSNIQADHGKFSFVKSDSENLNLTTSKIALTDVENAYSKTKASTHHTEL